MVYCKLHATMTLDSTQMCQVPLPSLGFDKSRCIATPEDPGCTKFLFGHVQLPPRAGRQVPLRKTNMYHYVWRHRIRQVQQRMCTTIGDPERLRNVNLYFPSKTCPTTVAEIARTSTVDPRACENDYFHYRRRENAYFPLRTRTVPFARSEGITSRRRLWTECMCCMRCMIGCCIRP